MLVDMLKNTTMSEYDNMSSTYWLQKDMEIASMLSPVVAFVSILMTSGIIGNSLVCYICYVKWKEKKIKYFIGALAGLDLITCCVCMPMEIAMLIHPLLLDIDALCKLQRFSRAMTSLAAGFVLVIIAIDRYISICKHTSKHIQPRQARWFCLGSILLALVFSWPSLILFGKLDRDKHVIAETSCSTSETYDDTSYPLAYYSVIFVLFFVISFSLVIFYSLIWIKIIRMPNLASTSRKRQSVTESDYTNSNMQSDIVKKMSAEKNGELTRTLPRSDTFEMKKKVSCTSEKSGLESSDNSCDLSTDWSRHSSIERKNKKTYYSDTVNTEEYATLTLSRTRKNTSERRNTLENKNKKSRRSSFVGKWSLSSYGSSRNAIRRRRVTVTMFSITAVQIFSFIPYISLLVCKSFIPNFLSELDSAAQIAYNIGILSHFFSSGVNPWVYGFCSKIFRREFKKAFCQKIRKFDIYHMNRS